VPVIKTVFVVLFVVMVFVLLSCRHRSQAAGRGVTGLDFPMGFDVRPQLPFALVRFLFVRLFRFTAALSQRIADASKTSLLSNR
jgi:hypothetical protein